MVTVDQEKPRAPAHRSRTVDELAHETAASMMGDIPAGQRAAVVIVSEMTGKGGGSATRTAWRFIHCDDPSIQARTLREIADLIERTARVPPG